MTGYFVRGQRDGKFQPLEFETLSDSEFEELKKLHLGIDYSERGWMWARWLNGSLKTLKSRPTTMKPKPKTGRKPNSLARDFNSETLKIEEYGNEK